MFGLMSAFVVQNQKSFVDPKQTKDERIQKAMTEKLNRYYPDVPVSDKVKDAATPLLTPKNGNTKP